MKKGITVLGTSAETVIRKWYKRLEIPSRFDLEFEEALKSTPIPEHPSIDCYDMTCEDGKRNLLCYLYMCENACSEMEKRGIPSEIITDTLKDIAVWNTVWSDIKGELYLGTVEWLANHLRGNIYKVGRLQFRMARAKAPVPSYGINVGDNILEIHIQGVGRLDIDECKRSIKEGRTFIAKYFPEFKYKHVTCDSWLLDPTLSEYLSPESNIIRFGNLFDRVENVKSNVLIRYLFPHDMTEEKLSEAVPSSSFAKKVKEAILSGKCFNQTFGVLKEI